MKVEIKTNVHAEVTPELLAQVFWNMSDSEQAEFFGCLARTIKQQTPNAYGLGEMQWCYLHGELQKRYSDGDKEPLQMYLALSTFAFQFAQDSGRLQQKMEPWQ